MCSRVICKGQRSVWWRKGLLKSDFRLRIGITAIEAQQKMQVSRSGYAVTTILIHCGLTLHQQFCNVAIEGKQGMATKLLYECCYQEFSYTREGLGYWDKHSSRPKELA